MFAPPVCTPILHCNPIVVDVLTTIFSVKLTGASGVVKIIALPPAFE